MDSGELVQDPGDHFLPSAAGTVLPYAPQGNCSAVWPCPQNGSMGHAPGRQLWKLSSKAVKKSHILTSRDFRCTPDRLSKIAFHPFNGRLPVLLLNSVKGKTGFGTNIAMPGERNANREWMMWWVK